MQPYCNSIARWLCWVSIMASLQVLKGCRMQLLQGGGAAWKSGCFREAPRWVQAVMANNFKTLAGAFTVLGLMGLPLHLFATRCAWHWSGSMSSMCAGHHALTAYGAVTEDSSSSMISAMRVNTAA